MATIYLRKSTLSDLDAVMEIIEEARALLKKDGSPQWQNGSPNRDTLKNDIESGINWVLIVDGKIAGAATLLESAEPSYSKIFEGSWNNTTEPYATTHRVAISSKFRGMHLSKFMFTNLTTIAIEHGFKNMRIDTHEMNERMQGLAKSLGYHYRGIVYVDEPVDGKRLAYELNL
ncbi:GNAT family N-acetyltransferase [Companilactobacillus sp.]|jgi:RimJ/RimL family protein N-acetyltransferase|uniref:GNAT family N-acetyltransferase n=1 Tax=Companilactobacillus sp. TaxID=2767905 RepID=UPI0025C5E56D|nr:GNAT family N-acetyltransferase [Companilactobacillus sp.]MCH4008775.1 GNAT family N-acetyltransferase [Companilactobacillus sp.]MCH4051046.1 GNAT family N-acetyltransferase [Companilactobacillus sp.]MCH4076718.1 GNAT family N-acetyltransferase [Companilactobacillus sp.]MCH4125293.1 GNAT family N-acetyltransferase [Companilactobacillus sp.]MCH4131833.1 GNAT family N-acetyltransferase [Companilactobacillus sp.]